MVSWVIVKLPYQTSPKGDHIPHEQEYTQDMAYRQSLMKYAEKYGVSRASRKYIKNLHFLLMSGTVDERKKRVISGQYRSATSNCRIPFLLPADHISPSLKTLISENAYRLNSARYKM